MGTRSVRLGDEAESALTEIVNRTGSSISEAIKQGQIEYRDKSRQTPVKTTSSFFEQFDLGEGGYINGNARDAKSNIRSQILQPQNLSKLSKFGPRDQQRAQVKKPV